MNPVRGAGMEWVARRRLHLDGMVTDLARKDILRCEVLRSGSERVNFMSFAPVCSSGSQAPESVQSGRRNLLFRLHPAPIDSARVCSSITPNPLLSL